MDIAHLAWTASIVCVFMVRTILCAKSCESFAWRKPDGEWGAWGPWNQCTASCGGGLRMRVRSCDSPAPSPGGQGCHGNSQELEYCNTQDCAAPDPLVAFSVGSSTERAPSSLLQVPMEVTFYNDGQYYHTNAFHAPYDGVYLFFFSGLGGSTQMTVGLHLYTQKVGEGKVHVARAADNSPSSGGSNGGAAGSVMVKMVTGETASVWLYGGNGLRGNKNSANASPTTLFWGLLVRKL